MSQPLIFPLLVSDTSAPAMRLYRGADGLGFPLFLCEVTGAGANWGDPYWQIKGEGAVGWLEGTTGRRIGTDGVFTRWSTVRLNSTLNVACACRHQNQTSVLVRSYELEAPDGKLRQCIGLYTVSSPHNYFISWWNINCVICSDSSLCMM